MGPTVRESSLRATATSAPASVTSVRDPATVVGGNAGANTEDASVDDAVLAMAAAMQEEEDKERKKMKDAEDKEDWFNKALSFFWSFLIVYSFGSVIIALTQGRIQDRTGGDFTLYDFFDNIFAFNEWSWETFLGFNPVTKWQELTGSA